MLDERNTGAIAALHDPGRRRLYEVVRDAGRPVSREEAAERTGISRSLAAFHLDKLVERGVLTFTYARPQGRAGPGAGRPAKMYRPSRAEISVSIPERHYDVIGRLLVDTTLADDGGDERIEVAEEVAAREGRAVGEQARRDRRLRRTEAGRTLDVATDLLRERGYEPYLDPDGTKRLRSCPFRALASHAPEVVCRMNRAFIEGMVRGIGNGSLEAALEPISGECCVAIRAKTA
jgi:predicted ArsR family transcriptional regulator